ncbi:UBX [Macleaya cordata]|uniref:UBX n=1 Tax=Macleaya cordata TaxID=56857 RepID=A0A200QKT3_MACCD|nr:UBX [Macleaya cordata]
MEQPMSLITFKGSISEAIIEAKQQKKLFVVYVSEENGAPVLMEESTSMDLNVADSVSKYCIFLHLVQGSTDASHFSEIYPQKSVPCVTIIGYNGVMLQQHEGHISCENLVSSIKQAWVSLQIQETTATVLTAALASKKTEPLGPNSSNVTLFEQGSSSSSDIPSSSKEKSLQDSKDQQLLISESTEENRGSEARFENEEASLKSIHANELESVEDEISASPSETAENLLSPVAMNLDMSGGQFRSSSVGGGCTAPDENRTSNDRGLEFLPAGSGITANVTENSDHDKKADSLDNFTARKSNDVHLNIRLPDGASLQKKFSVTDALRLVKDYVDENQRSGIGSYDLAVPYPRKVFNEQDLSKELSELGLFYRQALVVVPHHPASGLNEGESSSRNHTSTDNDSNPSSVSNDGYFGRVKRLLSFVNPFSYLGNNVSVSGSEQGSNDGLWQYRPNPNLRNQLSGTERTNTATSENASNKSRKPTTSSFGSNIHTLKHYEDDDPSRDRNTFWNGNSTEYGGNNDGK